MKRLIALVTGALVAAGLTVAPAQPAAAGSATMTGFPFGTEITLSFPDLRWNGPSQCLTAQVTGSVNGYISDDWWFEADIRLKADPTRATNVSHWSSDSGPFTTSFELCAKDHPSGLYEVVGYAEVWTGMSDTWAVVRRDFRTEFTLSQVETTTTLSDPTVVGTLTTFSGRVIAKSGAIDPAGQLAIETLTGTTWTRIGLGTPDASGYFAIPVGTVLPPGSQYRATYLGTLTCAASNSDPRVVPTPPVVQPMPTVKVKAVSGRSKLKVDVNPNMGRKYWTFQVQRKKADGTWKALKTYRTVGSSEKRTVNLPKGTYKVFVNPKFGYQGATSAEVVLKR